MEADESPCDDEVADFEAPAISYSPILNHDGPADEKPGETSDDKDTGTQSKGTSAGKGDTAAL